MAIRWRLLGVRLGTWCVAAGLLAQASGDTRAPPYDGMHAGLDAFRLAEERRQADVAAQVGLTAMLPFWSARPNWQAYGLDGIGTIPGRDRAFMPIPYFGASGWPARQPIGQQQFQAGPRRWESHPVYAPPWPALWPQPPAASPWLNGTPDATPAAPEPARRGPLEY